LKENDAKRKKKIENDKTNKGKTSTKRKIFNEMTTWCSGCEMAPKIQRPTVETKEKQRRRRLRISSLPPPGRRNHRRHLGRNLGEEQQRRRNSQEKRR